MKRTSISDAQAYITNIIQQEISGPYQVVLFGSRARKEEHRHSDRDFGIVGDQKFSFSTYRKIKHKLIQLPRVIDFVDFTNVDERFRKDALKDDIYM